METIQYCDTKEGDLPGHIDINGDELVLSSYMH